MEEAETQEMCAFHVDEDAPGQEEEDGVFTPEVGRCEVVGSRCRTCGVAVLLFLCVAGVPTLVERVAYASAIENPGDPHFMQDNEVVYNKYLERLGARLADFYHAQSENITNGTKARPPGTPFCSNNAQIFPGKLYSTDGTIPNLVWEPDAECKLKHFDVASSRECLTKRGSKFVMLGDSLVRGLSEGMAHKLNTTLQIRDKEYDVRGVHLSTRPNTAVYITPNATDAVMEFYWTQSSFLMDPLDAAVRKKCEHAVTTADYVFLHHGTWDLGATCLGVLPYYHALKARILQLKRGVKEGTPVAFFDMHYLYQGKCVEKYGVTGKCFAYNTDEKVKVYREATHLAAACTGTRVYSNLDIYKAMPHYTKDGVHYAKGPVFELEMDVFLNAMCPRDGSPPMSFIKYDCINEEARLTEMALIPTAVYCPHTLG